MSVNAYPEFVYQDITDTNVRSIASDLPTRQDYYQIIWLKQGMISIEMDFVRYDLQGNIILFVAPCQAIGLKSFKKVKGHVIKFTSAFFLSASNDPHGLMKFPFFCPIDASPVLALDNANSIEIEANLENISKEFLYDPTDDNDMLSLYTHALLINARRLFKIKPNKWLSTRYMDLVLDYKHLVDNNHLQVSSVNEYANLLAVTPKYLNEAAKNVLGKKASQVISDRVFLEARRLLHYSHLNVSEVATHLNFNDLSYFTKFFKKHSGLSPIEFKKETEKITN